ncbi:basic form of pathogenesis-related protein 1-like [Bidens hawaiensis]|uniref:basic form of pathogenesis-related protein 1-like n=1 Tax=Bidens hawaiensis TaxID=980011 RepID=UPI004049F7C0
MDLTRIIQTLAIVLLTFSCFIHVSKARGHPFLIPHNQARARVGVQPLAWNQTLATYAREYATQRLRNCALIHSGGPYGENLAVGYGDQFDANAAVNLWVGEEQHYDKVSNSCVGGACLHYTQVVWRNSTHLGCARVNCYDEIGTGWVVICSYDPPGNYVGERPY